jgi:adenylate cyclase
MELPVAYIPMDRRQAMVRGQDLPNRTSGAALFADISGFTPLTEALVQELGPKRGADVLTQELNLVYDALIAEVHRYRGSVITFSGDAITCWFDQDDGLRAAACALAMQKTMQQFAQVETPSGLTVPLAMKAAVASGPVRRFLVGDPKIQTMDVLAGATLDRMAAAEHQAERGEVVVEAETVEQLGNKIEIADWREDEGTGERFAVVTGLTCQVEATPWEDLPFSEQEAGEDIQPLTEERVQTWLLPPVYEKLKTGQERFLGDLRVGVALFLRFGGLDYDQDETAGEKLDVYLRWVQDVLAHYEGYMLQLTLGDKGCYLYGAFGAPLAHEDDPVRAVTAAMELRALPPEIDFITGAQIGISQGRMRTGAYGGTMRRTYGVIGDEVNLAARLMGVAEPGQILVSQRIADAVATSYRLKYLGPIKVKGKQSALPVSLVLDRQLPSLQRPATIFTNPLVGRDDELAQMERVLSSALTGEGQIIRLEGVGGVGKSHLAAEFVERALGRGFQVAMGACQSTSQGIAYHPWRQAFRALFELAEESFEEKQPDVADARRIAQVESVIKEVNPGWLLRLPLLGDLLGLPIPDNATTAVFDPQLRRESLLTLVVEIVQTWAQAQPLLLMIEDAHWMDEASLGMALALGRAITHVPILLVLIHRPPSSQDQQLLPDLNRLPYSHHLDLSELSPQGATALVTHRLQGIPSALAMDLIQAQAHGNPFFTEELVDALRESAGLCRQEDGTWALSEVIIHTLRSANCLIRDTSRDEWVLTRDAQLSTADLGIPDSIHGIVLSRLDRLPEAHKLTLKVVSVIGRIFEFDLLVQAHPVRHDREALLEQIQFMEERDFVRLETPPPRLTYMFKHNITQEVAYETLLEEQQRELHRAVGEALEGLEPEAIERLAYHYSRSRVRDKTLFYLDKAARKTQRDYANETALNYYNQALALEERWEWRKGQIKVLHILGQREDEQASLKILEATPGVPAFDATYLWGEYYETIGDYAQAQTAIERALDACQNQQDIICEAQCLVQLGLIARRRGDYESAKDQYNQALTPLQSQRTRSSEKDQTLAYILNELGIVYRNQGDFDQAEACYEQALKLSRTNDDRRSEAETLNSLGVNAFYQRKYAEARAYHQQALEIRHAIGDRAGQGMSLQNLAVNATEVGDYGQAENHFTTALTIQQAIGNRWEEVNIWMGLGVLYQELGDLAKAQSCLEQGLRLSQDIGDEAGEAYILGNLGLVMRDQGDLEAAERLLSSGLALAQKQDEHIVSIFLSNLAIISLQAGKLNQAIERSTAALTMRQGLDLRSRTADDLATLAATHLAIDQIDQALSYAQRALGILEECGGEGPESPQRDYFLCYQVLAAAGRAIEAQMALQSAHNLVMTRAEKIADPVLRQSFLERVQINHQIVQEYENAIQTRQA